MPDDLTREQIEAAGHQKALDDSLHWRIGYEKGYRTGYLDARAKYKTCDHCIEEDGEGVDG